jgi:NDP-sugar pyrophosphorylase family protein
MKINVLMLAAGTGSRFTNEGWAVPKPLLDVKGQPMFLHALSTLNLLNECNYHFIFQQSVIDEYDPAQYIDIDYTIHSINGVTDGAATTAHTVIKQNDKLPWLIIDCDFVIESDKILLDDTSAIFVEDKPFDSRASYSYVQGDKILCVAEKQLISNWRNAGLFYWSSSKLFCECYNIMRELNIRINGEFYIAPLYNIAIHNGHTIQPVFLNKFIPIGTPTDLLKYVKNST